MNMKAVVLAVLMLFTVSMAWPQDLASELHPPKGAKVAIVVFEDLQCPLCRVSAPLIKQAGTTYKIPVVIHDFPLPMHNWSFDAAVTAHYFDAHSKALGVEYRDYIFEHQPEITPQNLRSFSEKFASDHKMPLPFVIDPQGKLAGEVREERDMGTRIGIHQTPTIYVVSAKPGGKPYIEVTDRTQLFQTIDAMERD
ncbi:MAG: DsbA family protein [Terriglobales bacterium]